MYCFGVTAIFINEYTRTHIMRFRVFCPICFRGYLYQYMMQETQEDYYLVLFLFASQLYFYVLGSISILI